MGSTGKRSNKARRQTTQLVQYLDNAPTELEAFDNELQSGLSSQIYNYLSDWIEANAPNATEPIWNVVGSRCEHLEALANQAEKKETKEQVEKRIQSYFQNVNPGPIAQELQRACVLDTVWDSYNSSLSRFVHSPEVGPIIRRYHLPKEVVNALCSACMAPLRPTLDTLGIHAKQMQAHGELLQSLAEGQGLRTGLGIAASVAGSLLLGPLGAIGAGLLTGAATDPTSKVDASAERVGDTFEEFQASFVAAMEMVDTNVWYTLVSLYGGLLLRLEQDLNALGKRLAAIDLDTGEVQIELSSKALEEFDTWARLSLEQLHSLEKDEQWGRLGDAADKALRLTVTNPLRTNVVGTDNETAYTVEFARMRAVAINRVADIAWREGKTKEACDLYRHLISDTNVAWERIQEGEETPEDEVLHTAGLRLAIAATSNNGKQANLDDLAVLPAFVAQATARFVASEPRISASGEGVAGATILTAKIIAAYADEHGYDLRLADRMPAVVQRNGGLDEWTQLLQQKAVPASFVLHLVDEDTCAAHAEESKFLAWLTKRASREKKMDMLRRVLLSMIGVGVLVGGYFLVRWLFF